MSIRALYEDLGQHWLIEGARIAKTLLKQMGGSSRLKAMIGAKDFLSYKNNLQFKFSNGRIKDKPNYIDIELDKGSDTYTVEFGRISRGGLDYKRLRTVDGIYADQLKSLFERHTGLRLSP